jgi:hypothetical protein
VLPATVSRVILGAALFGALQGASLPFDVRARQELLFGKGKTSGQGYYDVVVTRQPETGVAIKLPYTSKGGRFYFDLHHRIALTPDFELPATVTTVVEVVTGGTNSLGVFTISGEIDKDAKLSEEVARASNTGNDRFVTPMSRKTVTVVTQRGPQSISIVGKSQTISRNGKTTRIETPGERMAVVSNFKFEDAPLENPLTRPVP